MDHWQDGRGRLTDLSTEECWSLLGSRPVGRLAWGGSEGVTVLPLNFSTDADAVLVRTTPYSAVARECPDTEVAFEVDDFDAVERSGWSVLVRGRCRHEHLAEVSATETWPEGMRILTLSIQVRTISGRRLSPS